MSVRKAALSKVREHPGLTATVANAGGTGRQARAEVAKEPAHGSV